MKSNLFFFVLCFFSPLFELEKNENTWSRQAKFVGVDPKQKIAHDKNKKKAYSDYSAFRPVKPQKSQSN